MPRKTHTELAKRHNVAIEDIAKASRAGVNVQSGDALSKFLKYQDDNPIPPSIPEDFVYDEIEEVISKIEDKLVRSDDEDEIVRLNKKIDGLSKIVKLKEMLGEYYTVNEVKEGITKIGAAVKASYDKLDNELPGACAGLDEIGVLNAWKPLKVEGLKMLADMESDFWRADKK